MNQQKQLWIVNHYAGDGKSSGSSRHYYLASELVKLGWDVTIFASATLFKSQNSRLDVNEDVRVDLVDGIRFVWIKTSSYKGNGGGRIKSMLEFYYRLPRLSLLEEFSVPNAIIGSTVHPLAALAAYRLSKKFDAPFLFEVRDLWPQTLIDMGKISRYNPLAILLRRLECYLYRRADSVITLLPGIGKYLKKYNIDEEKVVWISNGVSFSNFSDYNSNAGKIGNEFLTLMYLGSHGEANGLDVLIEAMGMIKQQQEYEAARSVVLRLVGEGPLKERLMRRARELGVYQETVFFEKAVPKTQVPHLASEADGFVIPVLNMPRLYQYGISMNKIFDYMAAGKPTIIAVAAYNNPIFESGGGITIPPEDAKSMAKAISDFSALPMDVRTQMGNDARKHVELNYSYLVLARKLDGVLQKNIRQRAGGV